MASRVFRFWDWIGGDVGGMTSLLFLWWFCRGMRLALYSHTRTIDEVAMVRVENSLTNLVK